MRLPLGIVAGAALALFPTAAAAHGGAGVSTSLAELPGIVALLGVLGVPYAVGIRRLWRHAGPGRGVRSHEVAAFTGGLAVLGVALLGPVFVPATQEFSGHMAQHLLLLVVAAPLLAFGRPGVAYAWLLGDSRREVLRVLHRAARHRAVRVATHPAVLLGVYVAVIWTWHVPAFYDAAARSEALHGLEHATLFGASFAFWWRIWTLELAGGRRQVLAFALLFAAIFPELVLGAFIGFAREPLYEGHRLATEARGGDPLTDQQLGGFAMLMVGGLVYAGVALAGMHRFLSTPPRPATEQEWWR